MNSKNWDTAIGYLLIYYRVSNRVTTVIGTADYLASAKIVRVDQSTLSLCRPVIRFDNRKNILEDLFCSVLSHFKKMSPLWKPEIWIFRHFPKLKIVYFNGKKSFQFLSSWISLQILWTEMGYIKIYISIVGYFLIRKIELAWWDDGYKVNNQAPVYFRKFCISSMA